MRKNDFRLKKCQLFGHCLFVLLLGAFLAPKSTCAQSEIQERFEGLKELFRKPANYVPDDDVIVVPVVYEDNIFVKMKEDESPQIKRTRNQIRAWLERQEFEQAWGLQDRGIYNYPDQDERIEFFQRTYLRYLSKRAERTVTEDVQEGIKESWRSWTARDEVDAIKANQESSDFIADNKDSKIARKLTVKKTVKTAKKQKLKFSLQPRIEQGLVKMKAENDFVKVSAWVGVNNTQELRVEHNNPDWGFNAMTNYYIHRNELLVSLNQKIHPLVTASYTYREEVGGTGSNSFSDKSTEAIYQVRFGMAF